jgi:hypothetical protein
MNPCKQPSKELVREYMKKRISSSMPPPDLHQIRRALGMPLIEAYRAGK